MILTIPVVIFETPPPIQLEPVRTPGGRPHLAVLKLALLVLAGLALVLLASRTMILSVSELAEAHWHVPKVVIASTLVAFGTSVPEVATCVMAARKGHGEVAVGNIIGADILNICWVAGASSLANDLTLSAKETYFMFPWMFGIVGLMLILLRWGYRLTRAKGAILFVSYLLYFASFMLVFPPGTATGDETAPDDSPASEAPAP